MGDLRDYPQHTSSAYQNTLKIESVQLGRGLANCVRETLLSENRGNTSLLIDWAITQSMCDVWLTIDDILALAPFSEYLLRNALDDKLIESRDQKTTNRGRPRKLYRIPNKDAARKLTTPGNLTKSDHLPVWAFNSLKTYKIAMYFALIIRGCEYVAERTVSYSRSFLSKFLSVSKKTLRNYEKEFGIYVERDFDTSNITPANIHWLMSDKQYGGFLEVTGDGSDVTDRIPAIRSLAKRALDMGCRVIFKKQLPNRYSLMTWDIYRTGKPAGVYYPPTAN